MKQYIKVVFNSSSNQYTYSAPANKKIVKGDKVIVKTPSSELKIVTVTLVIKDESDINFSLNKIKDIYGTIKTV